MEERLFLRREMSDLTFNIEVARYAYLEDQIRNGLEEETVIDKIEALRNDKNVGRYIELENQYKLLDVEVVTNKILSLDDNELEIDI